MEPTSPPSRTSMFVAVIRGQHRLIHAQPPVLDDPYALDLLGSVWPALWEQVVALVPPDMLPALTAGVTARARWAEDQLSLGGFEQYVVLGAGLDTFAWRRADLLDSLRVFEVDHPATQAHKRERVAEVGWPVHPNHVFAPVDFEAQTLYDGLKQVGFDWSRPALFAMLGVGPYLTVEAFEETLRTVASAASGSRMATSYLPTAAHHDAAGRAMIETLGAVAAGEGEPFATALTPGQADDLLTRCGLRVVDHPDAGEVDRRYLAGRSDTLRMWSLERLIAGVVG